MPGAHDDGGWQTHSRRDEIMWELDVGLASSPVGNPRSETSAGVIGAVVSGLVAIVALTGWLLATSPSRHLDPVTAEQTASPPAFDPTPDRRDSAPAGIDDAIQFVETRASASFRQMLTEAAASMGIAYRTGDQLLLLDFARGEIAAMEESFVSGDGPSIELLRSADGRTYAVDATTRQATLVAGGGYVVETLWPGLVTRTSGAEAMVEPGDQATVGRLDGSLPEIAVPLPTGARLRAFPGVGLIAVTDDGSDLIGPSGLLHLSDNEIVSATRKGWLERSTTGAQSSLRVIDFDSREVLSTLPDALDEPGSSFFLSPDATKVLRVGFEGSAELYSLADGGITWVIGDGMQEPRWAPDSSFIVWLDTVSDEPQLKIMFMDPRTWIAVGLEEIGAGLPDDAELIIVS